MADSLNIYKFHLISVHAVLSDWGSWRDCSTTCEAGVTTRDRSCVSDGMHGGDMCTDLTLSDTVTCDMGPCPGIQKKVLLTCLIYLLCHPLKDQR